MNSRQSSPRLSNPSASQLPEGALAVQARALIRAVPPVLTLLLSACLNTGRLDTDDAAIGGVDTKPQGPAFGDVRVSGDGAALGPSREDGRFEIGFPAGGGKPAAVFTFAPADINGRLGVAIDIRNTGRGPVRVFADLNQDTWVRGYVTVPPGRTRTLYVFARRMKLAAADAEEFPGMHGIPGGKMSLWAGIEEPITASSLKLFMVMPRSEATIQAGNIRPFGSSKAPDAAGFFPFIDRFGQFSRAEWPGKTHSGADLSASIAREDRDLAGHPGPAGLDQFGGWAAGPRLEATGHFRVQKFQGKWWLVDPDGRLFWSDGIDCVGFSESFTHTAGRERFYEDPAPNGDFLGRNLREKYGADWRESATNLNLARLRSWGINTLGSWADPSFNQKHRIPYALCIPSGARRVPIDPDSPAWVEGMRSRLTAAAAKAKDDPWCIGYFVDNEIHASLDPAWFESYYRQVSAAGRAVMPNKLYLGSRLDYHDWPDVSESRKEIVRIAARYCDVVSFNFYKFTLDDVAMPDGVDKPAIVGEFHMGALDRGKFHTGLRSVFSQNQRAESYRLYVTSALRNPAIVGAHWFQLYDESTTGRFDGENYQIGFLDICDTPYVETVAAARDIGYRIYAIRSGSD
ncbi:MAG TPA: hypothetical protein VKG78_03970 [Opitutaceae bacterium]|nr:hypothetical protein [Opitutaceae bacterium]